MLTQAAFVDILFWYMGPLLLVVLVLAQLAIALWPMGKPK